MFKDRITFSMPFINFYKIFYTTIWDWNYNYDKYYYLSLHDIFPNQRESIEYNPMLTYLLMHSVIIKYSCIYFVYKHSVILKNSSITDMCDTLIDFQTSL